MNKCCQENYALNTLELLNILEVQYGTNTWAPKSSNNNNNNTMFYHNNNMLYTTTTGVGKVQPAGQTLKQQTNILLNNTG